MLEIVFVVFDFNYLGTYREPSFSDPDPLLCVTTGSGIEIRRKKNMKRLLVRGNKFPIIKKADRLIISNEHGRTEVSFIWLLF
jgi:hypothetical protein